MFYILIQVVCVMKLMKKKNSLLINTDNCSTRNGKYIFNTKLPFQIKKKKKSKIQPKFQSQDLHTHTPALPALLITTWN